MEDAPLRLLLIHADRFEYETKEKAVKNPEPIQESARKGELKDGLVVFCTIEKPDEAEPTSVAENAANSIEEVLGWIKSKRVMIYPYAHLSTNLASGDSALKVLKTLEQDLSNRGYEVSRSPFGWYKSFTITAKGHPLSELSRTITAETKAKKPVTTLK